MENQTDPTGDKNSRKQITMRKTLAIATEFGFIIVLPLVAFAFIGKWLEGKYQNKLYLIGMVLLAIISSSIWFYKRILEIYKEYTDF